MLENIIVLSVIVIAGYAIVEEEKEAYHKWLSNYSRLKEDLNEALLFWKQVFSNRIRRWAIAVILICQGGAISMIISMLVIFGVSYMLSRYQVVDLIDWTDERVQKVTTAFCVVCSCWWVFDALGIVGFFVKFLEIIVFVIVAIIAIVAIFSKIKFIR